MRKVIITVLILLLTGAGYWIFGSRFDGATNNISKSTDPINTTYVIDGKSVTLVNGMAESESSPGSASKIVTTVFGRPNYGDLNDDGINDAVTIVTQTGSGSGIFYYALVSLNKDGEFLGQPGILLGDRVSPQSVLVKNNIALVNYADRAPGEPMSTPTSIGVTKYIVVDQDEVKEFNILNKGEQLFSGNLIMSSEVRTFTPCGGTARWVIGTSTAYQALTTAYNTYKSTTTAYSSVFVTVSGIIVSAPTDGFGADYDYGIDIKTLLKVHPNKTCTSI